MKLPIEDSSEETKLPVEAVEDWQVDSSMLKSVENSAACVPADAQDTDKHVIPTRCRCNMQPVAKKVLPQDGTQGRPQG